jgi:hypothetical protein
MQKQAAKAEKALIEKLPELFNLYEAAGTFSNFTILTAYTKGGKETVYGSAFSKVVADTRKTDKFLPILSLEITFCSLKKNKHFKKSEYLTSYIIEKRFLYFNEQNLPLYGYKAFKQVGGEERLIF